VLQVDPRAGLWPYVQPDTAISVTHPVSKGPIGAPGRTADADLRQPSTSAHRCRRPPWHKAEPLTRRCAHARGSALSSSTAGSSPSTDQIAPPPLYSAREGYGCAQCSPFDCALPRPSRNLKTRPHHRLVVPHPCRDRRCTDRRLRSAHESQGSRDPARHEAEAGTARTLPWRDLSSGSVPVSKGAESNEEPPGRPPP
jgi:hypothetical protein